MSIDKFRRNGGVIGPKLQCSPPGYGFKLTGDGNFNIKNKILCSVGEPMSDNDAINVKYLKLNSITS